MSAWLLLIHWLASKLWLRQICAEDGAVYLERFLIRGWMPQRLLSPVCRRHGQRHPGFNPRRMKNDRWGLYLHHFAQPDLDDVPHSHPWRWAVSLVLAGGYTEQRLVDGVLVARRVLPFRLNVIRHDTFHVVTELHGAETWSLIIVGPKESSWGFMVPGRGFTPWRERLAERGIPV